VLDLSTAVMVVTDSQWFSRTVVTIRVLQSGPSGQEHKPRLSSVTRCDTEREQNAFESTH
jgi:hypothetical protein